jgi:hypothetical protein
LFLVFGALGVLFGSVMLSMVFAIGTAVTAYCRYRPNRQCDHDQPGT